MLWILFDIELFEKEFLVNYACIEYREMLQSFRIHESYKIVNFSVNLSLKYLSSKKLSKALI